MVSRPTSSHPWTKFNQQLQILITLINKHSLSHIHFLHAPSYPISGTTKHIVLTTCAYSTGVIASYWSAEKQRNSEPLESDSWPCRAGWNVITIEIASRLLATDATLLTSACMHIQNITLLTKILLNTGTRDIQYYDIRNKKGTLSHQFQIKGIPCPGRRLNRNLTQPLPFTIFNDRWNHQVWPRSILFCCDWPIS